MNNPSSPSPFEPLQESLNRLSYKDIVFWWEKKRWVYNTAVGLCGLLGLVQIFIGKQVLTTSHIFEGVLVYGLLANLC